MTAAASINSSDDVSAWIQAEMRRRFAEQDALDEAARAGLTRDRSRAGNRTSVVFSVRIERGELDLLEREAVLHGLKPSVLARNLIRAGLADRGVRSDQLTAAVERVLDAVAELQTLVPRAAD